MGRNEKLIKSGKVVFPDGVREVSLYIRDQRIAAVLDKGEDAPAGCEIIDADGKMVMPGMIDTHNHMCDPGPYRYREDWSCGTKSAASGGITTICDMPLPCEPETVNEENFRIKEKAASDQAVVDYAFWGGMIPSNISEMQKLYELGCKYCPVGMFSFRMQTQEACCYADHRGNTGA
ncbi:MAG: amidohydrolase family protein [Lachnospiraceae bacterium]|nr:amidohydrolase family protein [Lachnospiraceae bacterium]